MGQGPSDITLVGVGRIIPPDPESLRALIKEGWIIPPTSTSTEEFIDSVCKGRVNPFDQASCGPSNPIFEPGLGQYNFSVRYASGTGQAENELSPKADPPERWRFKASERVASVNRSAWDAENVVVTFSDGAESVIKLNELKENAVKIDER